MLINFMELIRLVIMTLAIGYILSGFIQMPRPRNYIPGLIKKGLDWGDIKFAMYATAPAVVLHELAHKFTALAMGVSAEFFASYFGLGVGIFLRFINSPFLVFVPGYVSISTINTFQSGIIAFAGPFTNLLIFLFATLFLNYKKKMSRNTAILMHITKKINLFLFLFNMIPFGPFDGAKVFSAIGSLF